MKMPGGEGLAHRPVGNPVDALAPQASVSISLGKEKIEGPAVRRPVGPILNPYVRDRDPGALGNRPRPIEGRDGHVRASR